MKTYQFRIYPNKNQEVKLNSTLITCRRLYNNALAERKRQAELNRLRKSFDVFPWGKPEWINKYDQMLDLTTTKTPYQKEYSLRYSKTLSNGLTAVSRISFAASAIHGFRDGIGITVSHILKRVLNFKMENLTFQK